MGALAAPLVLPAAAAGEPTLLTWRYALSFPDPASGNVRVHLSLEGANGAITHLKFATSGHREPITNVTAGPATPLQATSNGIEFDVDGDESFTYDVMVERPAFNDASQRLAHLGTDFGLFKAESLTLEYAYNFYAGTSFQNRTFVEISPPPGWSQAAPWDKSANDTYVLPAGQTLPRGYVALGHFLGEEKRSVAGKDVHYVRLGNASSYDGRLFGLIENATPYYAAVYGPGVHHDVLVVNAPDPMFRGGLGGADSFFVHESADIRTVAHEYAHVFQLFGTRENPPDSSIWVNEGDADYHSALAMYAADVWTVKQVNDFFEEAAVDATTASVKDAVLTNAAYGTPLERFAYHKGALVLRALDETLRSRSGAQVTLSDVLRAMNAKHGDSTRPEAAEPATNAEMRNVSEQLVGSDLGTFFDSYVTGTKWPLPFAPFVPEGQLAVSAVDVQPPRASGGASLVIAANVTNRGTEKVEKVVELVVDGKRIASVNVSLGLGNTSRVAFPLIANATPGDHAVRVLYATGSYHTFTHPNVTLDHAAFVPATVRANQQVNLLAFLLNTGEEAGTARLDARVNDSTLGQTTETIIDGESSATITLPLRFLERGPTNLTLGVLTPQGNRTLAMSVEVLEADTDGDGVPDSQDAFPTNPSLTQRGIASAVQNTPLPAWVTLLGVFGAALALTRRRR